MVNIVIPAPLWRHRAGTLPGSVARLRDDLLASNDGFWFSGWDKSVLFQDVLGTVPVAAVNDPVLLMHDKSPQNRNALQATGGIAPNFTGVDAARGVQFTTGDYLDVAFPLSGDASFTCVMAVNITGGNTRKTLIEGYGNTNAWQQISFEVNISDKLNGVCGVTNDATSNATETPSFPFNTNQICTLHYDATASLLTLRRNGLVKETSVPSGAPAACDGLRIFANRTPDRYSEGKLYEAVFIRAAVDPAPIEAFMASRLGVTLGV
jgi:hypothetical protein